MRVLSILTVYNELDYLPLKVAWCRQHGLDLYVIDNCSNDGTWEYLRHNGIRAHRFDTNESFDLRLLQDEIIRTVRMEKPDWVVYNGADLFFQPDPAKTLHEHIREADSCGYNLIRMDLLFMCNTGERAATFDPLNTYFYYQQYDPVTLIHKYCEDVMYQADKVSVVNPATKHLEGVIINYGMTKSGKSREETLRRRSRAWETGLDRKYGYHYRIGHQKSWTWDKVELEDIRTSKYGRYHAELIKI